MKPLKPPSAAKIERDAAVAALHAIQRARPLKPPPGRLAHTPASAAALALQRDRKLGLV